MRRTVTDVSVVGRSVGRLVRRSVWNETIRYPGKTAGPIEMPFGMWGGVGDSQHVLDRGPDPPMVRGNFRGFPLPLKSIGIACSRVFSDM